MYNRNEAYDFKTLEEKEFKQGKVVRLPANKIRHKEKIKAQKMLLTSVFSIFLISSVCISLFVLGQATLTEFTDKASKASAKLNECKSINAQLGVKLENMQSNSCGSNEKITAPVEVVKVPVRDTAKMS